jgi:hypothetical protein
MSGMATGLSAFISLGSALVAADGIARGGRKLIELALKRGRMADGLKVVFNAIQASRSRARQGPAATAARLKST